MRLFEAPSTLLSIVAILLTSTQQVSAGPFSKLNDIIQRQLEERSEEILLQNATLHERSGCQAGAFACGYYGQVCCISGSEYCSTNERNEAVCKAGSGAATAAATGAGSWQTYTSTWIETNTITRTSIYSTWVAATATVAVVGGATCTPNWANQESPCGPVCCKSGQYCSGDPSLGICANAGNGGFTTTGVGYSAPVRPTTLSNGVVTTMTVAPTTTVPFVAPVATGSHNGTAIAATGGGGLSGGAIAGIVIGVLVGLALLIALCICCCLKAGFDTILALFGLGSKKRRNRRVVEEEYVETHRRHGSGSQGRWYGSAAGSRPSRPPPPPKKSGGIGGLLGATAGLGGLALALGLKRKHDRKEEKSDYSSSYGSSYYDYSSSKS
jgi:hypothetical protein